MLDCPPYIDGEETRPRSSQGTLGSSEENAWTHTDTYSVYYLRSISASA